MGMNTADKLAVLREAATPGPWGLLDRGPSHDFDPSIILAAAEYNKLGRHVSKADYPDAALIVTLVNAAPALEALVRAAEREHRSVGFGCYCDRDDCEYLAALAELGKVL